MAVGEQLGDRGGIRVGEDEVHAETTGEAAPPIGAEVWLTFKHYHVFDKASGRRLSSHGG